MKILIISIAVIFLFSCTKTNQGLHARLSITPGGSMNGLALYSFNVSGSSGPIVSWKARLYPVSGGPFQLLGPNKWIPATMTYGITAGAYDRAVLIVSDSQGNSDSTVINQQF